MLGIFFDIIVLAVILFFVDREEASDLFNLALTVCLMMITNLVIGLALVPRVGLLAIVPMMLSGLLFIRWRFTLTWTKTIVVLVGFYAAKFAFMVGMAVLMRTTVAR